MLLDDLIEAISYVRLVAIDIFVVRHRLLRMMLIKRALPMISQKVHLDKLFDACSVFLRLLDTLFDKLSQLS